MITHASDVDTFFKDAGNSWASCGRSHSTEMGAMSASDFAATFRLLDSMAETAMAAMLNTWPIPTRWSGVGGFPANLFHAGDSIRSKRIRESEVERKTKTTIEPAGMWKWRPRWRSIVKAWRIDKLRFIAIGVDKNMAVDHSGKILIMVLKSSTSLTLHNLHCFLFVPSAATSPLPFIAARFKNLHNEPKYNELSI
nr:hypothetical protein MIMGU_mgv1a014916mg [Ipomoea batatas]